MAFKNLFDFTPLTNGNDTFNTDTPTYPSLELAESLAPKTAFMRDLNLKTNLIPIRPDTNVLQPVNEDYLSKLFPVQPVQPLVTAPEVKQPKTVLTWLDGLGKSIAGQVAEQAVNVAESASSIFSRAQALGVGQNEGDYNQYVLDQGNKLNSGDPKQILQAIGNMSLNASTSNPLSTGINLIRAAFTPAVMKTETPSMKTLNPVEKSIRDWSGFDSADGVQQTVAGGLGSIIPSLQQKIPYVGVALMFMENYESIWQQQAKTQTETGASDNAIMAYALSSAAVETATEYMFPLFKKAGGKIATAGWAPWLMKKAGIDLATSTVGAVAKKFTSTAVGGVLKEMFGEGFEEVLSSGISGAIAQFTVEPDKKFFDIKDDGESNISLIGLVKAFAGGAIAGGVVGTVGTIIQNAQLKKPGNSVETPDPSPLFPNTIAAIDAIADQTAETLEQKHYDSIEDALRSDIDTDEKMADLVEIATTNIANVSAKENNSAQASETGLQPAGSPVATVQGQTSLPDAQAPSTVIERAKKIKINKQVKQTQAVQPEQTALVDGKTVIRNTPGKTVSVAENPAIANSPAGNEVEVTVNAKRGAAKALVRAVDIGNLIGSYDADGNMADGYDWTLQPRGEKKGADLLMINDIASDPNMLMTVGMESLQAGTPVVLGNGMVLAGNNRLAGFKKMMRDNPAAYEQYKAYVRKNASKFGIDPESLVGNFLLVRQIDSSEATRATAEATNVTGVRRMSDSEQAVLDAEKITDDMLELFKPNEDGDFTGEANRDFIRAFVGTAVDRSEHSAILSTDKMSLSQQGVTRVRNAIFHRAYGNIRLLELIADSKDETKNNLKTALVRTASKVLKIKGFIARKVLFNIDFSGDIARASELYVKLRGSKNNKETLQTILRDKAEKQASMFDSEAQQNDAIALDMAQAIASLKSGKQIYEFYDSMLQCVLDAGNPLEQTMFDTKEPPTRIEVLNGALRGNYVEEATVTEAEGVGSEILPEPSAETQPTVEPVKAEGKQEVVPHEQKLESFGVATNLSMFGIVLLQKDDSSTARFSVDTNANSDGTHNGFLRADNDSFGFYALDAIKPVFEVPETESYSGKKKFYVVKPAIFKKSGEKYSLDQKGKLSDSPVKEAHAERLAKSKQEVAPAKMTEEEFLASKGAGRDGIGDVAMHKNIGKGKPREDLINRQTAKDDALIEKRKGLRQEYADRVASGDIVVPTNEEQLIETAKGHPDNASVQAAQRVLAKREARKAEVAPAEPIVEPVPVAPKEQIKVLHRSLQNFADSIDQITTGMRGDEHYPIFGYKVVDGVDSHVPASISIANKTIFLNKGYYKKSVKERRRILVHEYVHALLADHYKRTGTDKREFLANNLYGNYDATTGKFIGLRKEPDVEESVVNFLTDMLLDADFEAHNYTNAQLYKRQYASTAGLLDTMIREQENIVPVVTAPPATGSSVNKRKLMKDIAAGKVDTIEKIEKFMQTEEGQAITAGIDTLQDALDALDDAKLQLMGYRGAKEVPGIILEEFGLKIAVFSSMADKIADTIAYNNEEMKKARGDQKLRGVKSFMPNFVDAMKEGKTGDVLTLIEANVKFDDLIYNVTTEQSVIDTVIRKQATMTPQEWDAYVNREFVQLQNNKLLWRPEHTIMLTKYAKKLIDENTIDSINKGSKIGRFVTNRLHSMGVSIRMAYLVRKDDPMKLAENIIKEFNSQIDPFDAKLVDEMAQLDFTDAKNERLNALNGMVSPVIKKYIALSVGLNEDEYNELISERSLPDILADRIGLHARIKDKVKKGKSAEQRMLDWLYAKYSETNKSENKRQASDINLIVAEMVLKRKEYAEVWDEAQGMVKQWVKFAQDEYNSLDDADKPKTFDMDKVTADLQAYLNTLANPVTAYKYMNRLIAATFKSMGKTLNEASKEYFLNGDESVAGFVEQLNKNMEKALGKRLDDASTAYLLETLMNQLHVNLDAVHVNMKERFKARIAKGKGKKLPVTTQDYIVEKMSNAAYYESMGMAEFKSAWATKLGVPDLDEPMIADIYATMIAYAQAPEKDKNKIYDDLAQRLADKVAATPLEKFIAWRRFSMLMSPVSWLKNTVSNAVTYPVSYMTNRLTHVFEQLWGVPQEMQIAGEKWISVKADSDIAKVVKASETNADMKRLREETAKYSIGRLLTGKKKLSKHENINAMLNIPFNVLGSGTIATVKKDSPTYKRNYKRLYAKNLKELNWSESLSATEKEAIQNQASKQAEEDAQSVTIAVFGDDFWFIRHFQSAMANKMNALGYKESMSEDEKKNIIDEAVKRGTEVAIINTFRQMNTLSKMFKKLRSTVSNDSDITAAVKAGKFGKARNLRAAQKAVITVLDVFQPFVITPAALLAEGYKYSPLAGLSAIAQFVYHKSKGNLKADHFESGSLKGDLSKKFAQAIVGTTGSFVTGILLAALGVLDGAPPESDKEKEMWKLQGRKAYSLYIPGIGSLSIDWMQPISTGLLMGGNAYHSLVEGKTFTDKMGKLTTSMIDTLFMNSVVDNLRTQFGSGNVSGAIGELGLSAISQSLPGIIRRFNRVLDPYERQVYSPDAMQSTFNNFVQHIPFVGTMLLPVQVDMWGNPIKQLPADDNTAFGVAGRFFLNMISPMTVKPENMDATTKEILQVYENTKDKEGSIALPPMVNQTFSVTVDGVKSTYTLTGAEYVDFQKRIGALSYKFAGQALAMGGDDYEKAATLKKAYAAAVKIAREEYIEAHPNG